MNQIKSLFWVALLVLLVGFGGVSNSNADLTDGGFNTPLTNSFVSIGDVLVSPYTLDTWGDESAAPVTTEFGVSPFEGNAMMRMDFTGGVASQVAQRIDVSADAAAIDAGLATVDMGAMFNVTDTVTAASASIQVYYVGSTLSGNLFTTAISNTSVGSSSIGGLDNNPNTWQALTLSNDPVPVGTRSLLMHIAYNNASLGGNPGYVDAAYLRLSSVPEPSGCLVGVGTLLAAVGFRRKRR